MINLLINLVIGLSVGASVLTAQYYGAHDDAGVSSSVHTAMTLSVIGGLTVGLVNTALEHRGVQIGIVNYTEFLTGFQIGIANIVTKSTVPFFPIINFCF